MKFTSPTGIRAIAVILAISFLPLALHAQGTAFTYQGELNSSSGGVTGQYDFQFAVYDSPSGGTQIGSTIVTNGIQVVNGLFVVTLDFDANVFTGNERWLDLAAHMDNSPSPFVSMVPRQQLTPTPYAIYAGSAVSVSGISVQQNVAGAPNVIEGSPVNFVSAGIVGATIGGGGATNSVGASYTNSVTGDFGTVAGGNGNTATNDSAVGGGFRNTASSVFATVSGGSDNIASGFGATVSGGRANFAGGLYATASGGRNNTASGDYSFAAGQQAQATNQGAFVWADSRNAKFFSTADNQFSARATGGFQFVTAIDGTVNGNPTAGVSLASGSGTWSSLSDRNAKKDFAPLDPQTVLAQVVSLPLTTWSYKSEPGVRHMGPMAQDFHAAFQIGEDERHITEVDESGVALAAIQGLNEKLDDKDALIHRQAVEISDLKTRLDALEKMVRTQK